MKKIFIILSALAALLLVGCNDPAPVATVEPEGEKVLTEQVITEQILVEDVITWDNVPTQTWD